MISIIIASRNEGQEIYDTIKAIKDSVDIPYEIIVIDDCSTEPIKSNDAVIVRNNTPQGVFACFDHATYMAKYDNIAIFNARMRFFTKNWASIMVDNLSLEPETLFCTTSAVLSFEEKEKPISYRYGANIVLNDKIDNHYQCLSPVWAKQKKEKIYEIPCVLGANYFIRKKLYNQVRGFSLLSGYGGALVYFSLKIWAIGGKVKICKDVKIGNIYYNEGDKKPWSMNLEDYFYNRIITAFILLDWDTAIECLYKHDNEYIEIIKNRILKNMPEIMAMREYISKNKKQDINHLIIK